MQIDDGTNEDCDGKEQNITYHKKQTNHKTKALKKEEEHVINNTKNSTKQTSSQQQQKQQKKAFVLFRTSPLTMRFCSVTIWAYVLFLTDFFLFGRLMCSLIVLLSHRF